MIWKEQIEQLPSDQRELAKRAATVSRRAHAPFSDFKVGAALRTTKGDFFSAANVENGSYGLTSCAERNAIFRAVAQKGPTMRWDLIALVADIPEPDKPPTISPCGACRQVLDEFKSPDGATVLFIKKGGFVTMTISRLLPVAFHFKKADGDH